jgi:hypothetical protein
MVPTPERSRAARACRCGRTRSLIREFSFQRGAHFRVRCSPSGWDDAQRSHVRTVATCGALDREQGPRGSTLTTPANAPRDVSLFSGAPTCNADRRARNSGAISFPLQLEAAITVSGDEHCSDRTFIGSPGGRRRGALRMYAAGPLEDAGFEVVEAKNASDALNVMQTRPDVRVLFTDIHMPGALDCMELAHEQWSRVLLLITSGNRRPSKADIPDHGRFPCQAISSERCDRRNRSARARGCPAVDSSADRSGAL